MERPFSTETDPRPLMEDLELIEFLLECPYVEDQLEVSDDHIAVDVIVKSFIADFFKAMAKTGRKYTANYRQVQFERMPQLKITK